MRFFLAQIVLCIAATSQAAVVTFDVEQPVDSFSFPASFPYDIGFSGTITIDDEADISSSVVSSDLEYVAPGPLVDPGDYPLQMNSLPSYSQAADTAFRWDIIGTDLFLTATGASIDPAEQGRILFTSQSLAPSVTWDLFGSAGSVVNANLDLIDLPAITIGYQDQAVGSYKIGTGGRAVNSASIPEPGVGLVLAAGAMAGIIRRRKRKRNR